MINTITIIAKQLCQMTIALFILGLVGKLFLTHTFIGKIIYGTFKGIYKLIRESIKITKSIIKTTINTSKSVINVTKSMVLYTKTRVNNRAKSKKLVENTEEKVVNGNDNIVDFNSQKELRLKWDK